MSRMPKKRITDGKTAALCATLGNQEEEKERRKLVEQCHEMCKKAKTPQLRAVQALLRGGASGLEARFQRGTVSLGGSAHNAVPGYAVIMCLEKAT
eukprot:2756388-Lingulodinium_polyedra.AAC.1